MASGCSRNGSFENITGLMTIHCATGLSGANVFMVHVLGRWTRSRSFQTGRSCYSTFGLWRTADSSSSSPQWSQYRRHQRRLHFLNCFKRFGQPVPPASCFEIPEVVVGTNRSGICEWRKLPGCHKAAFSHHSHYIIAALVWTRYIWCHIRVCVFLVRNLCKCIWNFICAKK